MNKVEKDEISQLPDKYRPLTVWSIIGWSILFNAFFLISCILTVVFAFNSGNINRRSLARVYLLFDLIAVILIGIIIAVLILTGVMDQIISMIQDAIYEMMPN